MSLRARKKRLSMRAVQAAAMNLFERSGFEPVAVEEISEASGVSPSTIYRHFLTKEGVVVWDEQDEAVEAALRKHLGKETPFAVLRLAFTEAYSGLGADSLAMQRRRADLIDGTPALQAALAGSLVTARQELLAAMAEAYGRKGKGLEAEMAVRIALECLLAGFDAWQAGGLRASLPKAIDRAFGAAGKAVR